MKKSKPKLKTKNVKLKFENDKLFIDDYELNSFDEGEAKKFLFAHLYNGVNEDEFLVFDKESGRFNIKGKTVGLPELRVIKEHAKLFATSDVFKLILNEMRSVGLKKMFDESKTVEDLLAGKMMLYNIEVLQKKIEKLSRLEIPK